MSPMGYIYIPGSIITMNGLIEGIPVARILASVDRIARWSFDKSAVFLVGSATYKRSPRDVDILVIPYSPRGGELARFYRGLQEALGDFAKVAGSSYTGCSDRIIGEWRVWVGVIPREQVATIPPVLRSTWRENYVAVRGPPLELILPPAEITVEEVAYGQYGVEFCKRALETGVLRELLLEGDSFVVRKTRLNEEQLSFLRQYCYRWNLRNLKRARQTNKALAKTLLREIGEFTCCGSRSGASRR